MPVLNGTENSRPAFILDAGIVHNARRQVDLAPPRPARLSGPHRRQRDRLDAQHRRRVLYFTNRIAPSAAAITRCGRAG